MMLPSSMLQRFSHDARCIGGCRASDMLQALLPPPSDSTCDACLALQPAAGHHARYSSLCTPSASFCNSLPHRVCQRGRPGPRKLELPHSTAACCPGTPASLVPAPVRSVSRSPPAGSAPISIQPPAPSTSRLDRGLEGLSPRGPPPEQDMLWLSQQHTPGRSQQWSQELPPLPSRGSSPPPGTGRQPQASPFAGPGDPGCPWETLLPQSSAAETLARKGCTILEPFVL